MNENDAETEDWKKTGKMRFRIPSGLFVLFHPLPAKKGIQKQWKKSIKTSFIKPKFGDASGVRGAAILGRNTIY